MVEKWLPVTGHEDSYDVSSLGRVRSKKRIVMVNYRNGDNIATTFRGRILTLSSDRDGYKKVSFSVNGKNVRLSVHRLVAVAFLPNPGSKPQINHIDNNPENNRSRNLEWATPTENAQHAIRAKRYKIGREHYRAKLNDSDIRSIRSRLGQGEMGTVLAREFGMSPSMISRIRLRKSWKHLR